MARHVQANELGHRLDIPRITVKRVGGRFGNRAAEAGADGIDEDQVRDIEDGILVNMVAVGVPSSFLSTRVPAGNLL
jgi:hypothetical protein